VFTRDKLGQKSEDSQDLQSWMIHSGHIEGRAYTIFGTEISTLNYD
jgi:hypothetical protein